MKTIDSLFRIRSERVVVNVDGQPVEKIRQKKVYREVKITSPGFRLIHFIVDRVLVYLVLILMLAFIVILGGDPEYWTEGFGIYPIYYSSFLIYYGFFEGVLGTTVGKLLTGSVVVDDFGQKPGIGKALLRTLCRIIPFEALSCIAGRGWHDSLTHTWVITRKERAELLSLLQQAEGSQDQSALDELVEESF